MYKTYSYICVRNLSYTLFVHNIAPVIFLYLSTDKDTFSNFFLSVKEFLELSQQTRSFIISGRVTLRKFQAKHGMFP
jgi:hypothetical protein